MFDTYYVLTRNELRGYFRRKASVFWALIFPVFLLTVMTVAFGRSTSLGQVRVAFSGETSSAVAQSCRVDIEAAFAASGHVQARFVPDPEPGAVGGPGNAGASVAGDAADLVRVVFPAAGRDPARVVYDFNGSLALKAASRTIEVALVRCVARARGLPPESVVRFENVGSGKAPFDYGNFFASGILIMAFMIIGMNSTASGIGTLRERNTFKIYVCFPVSRLVFLASLVSARIVMMLLSVTTLMLVARYGFGIDLPLWKPQFLRALPILVLGGVMLLGFGILIASRGRSLPEIELWSNLTYYPLLFFSDLTIPLTAVPEWMRSVLKVIPTNQFAVALRAVLFDDASYAQIAFPLITMACWAVVCLTLGTLKFQWHQD
jgi:ABC-2 type transport system permease protein